jgi:prefoldin beta subunit
VIPMVSKDVQELLVHAQTYQQQLQLITSQKEALNMQLIESRKALEELSKPGKDEVYKITGPVLVKVTREDAKKEIESKNELVMVRLKSFEKSEASLNEKIEELKEKLSKAGV